MWSYLVPFLCLCLAVGIHSEKFEEESVCASTTNAAPTVAAQTYALPYPTAENPNGDAIKEATSANQLASAGKSAQAALKERKAVMLFRGACLHTGFRGDVWANLALATR